MFEIPQKLSGGDAPFGGLFFQDVLRDTGAGAGKVARQRFEVTAVSIVAQAGEKKKKEWRVLFLSLQIAPNRLICMLSVLFADPGHFDTGEFEGLFHVGADRAGEHHIDIGQIVEVFAMELHLFGGVGIHRLLISAKLPRTKTAAVSLSSAMAHAAAMPHSLPVTVVAAVPVPTVVGTPFVIVFTGMAIGAILDECPILIDRESGRTPHSYKHLPSCLVDRYRYLHGISFVIMVISIM
jgi:hypothetical protein